MAPPLQSERAPRGSPGAGWRTPGQAGLGSEGPRVRSDSACRITLGLPRVSGRACWGDGHPPAQCERAHATPLGLGFPVCEGTGPSCAGPGLAWASPRESQGARGGRNQRPGQEVNPKSQEPGGGPSPPWPGLWDLTHTWGCLEAERQPQGLPGREGGVRCALV